jgi:hypothetical protein
MPSYLPENNTAQPMDNAQRSLQKLVDLGGTVISGTLGTLYYAGVNPEGNVVGSPGYICTCSDGSVWLKMSGTATNTGWQQKLQ